MVMTIGVASSAEASALVDVITLAFASDPMARWSMPGPATYLAVMPQVVKAFGGRAFIEGTADYAEGYAGGALWLAPGAQPDDEALGAIMQAHVPADRLPDMMTVFERMAEYHPHEPHWYLPLIGVDPARQGQGVGSALLAHAAARLDRDHLPAYLESSNPRNIPLYERYGFRIIGEIQVGSSPVLTPMLRSAR